MPGRFYFAYVDPTEDTFAPGHVRYDEQILSLDFEHTEGNFASLTLVIKNPRIGLLNPVRKQWAWVSWDSVGDAVFANVVPIIFGQVVGIPSDLQGETLEIQFLAKPVDFGVQQTALSESLKVLPYYDPVWIQDSGGEPNTVLEAISALWHIDRLTHEVTVSDIITGEDGAITIDEADHFYQEMSVSFSQVPLNSVAIEGTVTWAQIGSGDVDITERLVAAFQAGGSPFRSPIVATMTGEGLLTDWPTPGASMKGGWTVGAATAAADAGVEPKVVIVEFQDYSTTAEPVSENPFVQHVVGQPKMFNAAYPVGQLRVNFTAHYDANRNRSEIVSLVLAADVQEVFTAQVSSGTDSSEAIALSSNFIDQAIDPGGGIPLTDPARPSYFKTDRGQQSFMYLLLLARAKLLARARCCTIECRTKFEIVALGNLSCRMNAVLNDSRLPGGTATGKIVGYKLHVDGSGGQYGGIVLAATVGNGGAVASSAGTPTYVDPGYVDPGYQQYADAVLDVVPGELVYEDFADFAIDDDDVDLLHMDQNTVVDSITVQNGLLAQIAQIQLGAKAKPPDPSKYLDNVPTIVTVDLKPVTGGAFQTILSPVVSPLKVPKTIDLAGVS